MIQENGKERIRRAHAKQRTYTRNKCEAKVLNLNDGYAIEQIFNWKYVSVIFRKSCTIYFYSFSSSSFTTSLCFRHPLPFPNTRSAIRLVFRFGLVCCQWMRDTTPIKMTADSLPFRSNKHFLRKWVWWIQNRAPNSFNAFEGPRNEAGDVNKFFLNCTR